MQNSKYNLKTEGKKKKERGIRRQICVFLCIGNTGMMMMHDKQQQKEGNSKKWREKMGCKFFLLYYFMYF